MRLLRSLPLSPLVLAAVAFALAGGGFLMGERSAMQPAPAATPVDRMTTAALPSASGSAAQRRAPLTGPLDAKMERVIDGDTFEARVRVWFGQDVVTLVRLRGVDAPELKAGCAEELDAARSSRSALEELLGSGRLVLTEISDDKYFGRVVARVTLAGDGFPETDIATALIAAGMPGLMAGASARAGAARRRARVSAFPAPCPDVPAGWRRRPCAAPPRAPPRRR